MKQQRWRPDSQESPGRSAGFSRSPKRFYPDYLLEILFFVFILIELDVALALLFPPSIGREINLISPYQPRPEWYYLWLFGLLRYFYGGFSVVGGIILPFLALISLFLIPWIDKRLSRVSATIIIIILLLFFVGSVFLV